MQYNLLRYYLIPTPIRDSRKKCSCNLITLSMTLGNTNFQHCPLIPFTSKVCEQLWVSEAERAVVWHQGSTPFQVFAGDSKRPQLLGWVIPVARGNRDCVQLGEERIASGRLVKAQEDFMVFLAGAHSQTLAPRGQGGEKAFGHLWTPGLRVLTLHREKSLYNKDCQYRKPE